MDSLFVICLVLVFFWPLKQIFASTQLIKSTRPKLRDAVGRGQSPKKQKKEPPEYVKLATNSREHQQGANNVYIDAPYEDHPSASLEKSQSLPHSAPHAKAGNWKRAMVLQAILESPKGKWF